MKLLLAIALASCSVPDVTYPVPPLNAEKSTYKIYTPVSTSGTAWVIAPHYVATAGHVCRGGAGNYTLVSDGGLHLIATPVTWIFQDPDSTADHEPWDVCLLHSESPLGPPLPLAYSMPKPGDPVEYVGYPNGVWTHKYGLYVGDADEGNWDNYFSTAACDHGASGSAMYNQRGVYGVLVRLYFDGEDVGSGEQGCVASPVWQIKMLLSYIKAEE